MLGHGLVCFKQSFTIHCHTTPRALPRLMQVSQKQAARTAEQGRSHVHRSSQPFQSRASPLQQPPTAQHTQRAWPQQDGNSMLASSQDVADGQAPPADGRGLKAAGGEGVAATLASDMPAAYQGRQAQQVKLFLLHPGQHVVRSLRKPHVQWSP